MDEIVVYGEENVSPAIDHNARIAVSEMCNERGETRTLLGRETARIDFWSEHLMPILLNWDLQETLTGDG